VKVKMIDMLVVRILSPVCEPAKMFETRADKKMLIKSLPLEQHGLLYLQISYFYENTRLWQACACDSLEHLE